MDDQRLWRRHVDDAMIAELHFARHDCHDGMHVVVTGEIDQSTAMAFRAEVEATIMDTPGPIVLDLGGVTFMDSSGILALLKAGEFAGPRLRIGTVHRSVRRVLELTSLLERFEIQANGDVGVR